MTLENNELPTEYNKTSSLTRKVIRDELCKRVRENGGNQQKAFNALGIHKRTYFSYLEAHPDFKARVKQSVKKGQDIHDEFVIEASRSGKEYLAELLEKADIDPKELKVTDIVKIVELLNGEKEKIEARTVHMTQNNYNFDNLDAADLKTLMDLRDKMETSS